MHQLEQTNVLNTITDNKPRYLTTSSLAIHGHYREGATSSCMYNLKLFSRCNGDPLLLLDLPNAELSNQTRGFDAALYVQLLHVQYDSSCLL